MLLFVITAVMLEWSPVATAQDTSFRTKISYYIDADGTGMLIANPAPYGQGSVSWAACPTGGMCYSAASDPRSDRVLHVGDAEVGTVFVATAVHQSQMARATSVPYLGPVRALTPPRIKGPLRVGALVKPLAGSWSGGFGHETSFLQTQVCRSASGSGCVVVADAFYWDKCPGAGAVLTAAYLGWYVRVIDKRMGPDAVFPAFRVPSPARLRPIQPGAAAAATVAGPIAHGRGRPESNCGLPPSFALAAHPARRHGRLELGRITCPQRCRVRVVIRQGSRRVRLAHTLSTSAASRRLLLPARLARRLKPGVATASVSIAARTGRHTISSRRIVLP